MECHEELGDLGEEGREKVIHKMPVECAACSQPMHTQLCSMSYSSTGEDSRAESSKFINGIQLN